MGIRGPKGEQTDKAISMGLVVKTRPKPPRRMPKVARDCWRRIVESKPIDHFHQSELFLLEKYCMAEEIYHQAMEKVLDGHLAIVTDKGYALPDIYLTIAQNQVKLQTVLATKLRIATNSRISNFKAASEKEEPQNRRKDLMFGGKK
jgi:phage terminase small subunit